MSKYKTIVFDIDGTLLNTDLYICLAFLNLFQKIFISISNCRFFLILRGFPRLFNKPKIQKRGDFLKYH